MRRTFLLFFALISSALSAQVRLYLTDGTYHLVREYKVLPDRVRYFSTERGDWEELPKDLVDLKKTQQEAVDQQKAQREDAAALDAEEKAERAAQQEIARVPQEPGVYYINGAELQSIPPGETKVVTNKRRSVLTKLSPLPVLTGKATVELDGPQSKHVVSGNQPEFYIRLSAEQRFGIVKATPTKTARIVEKVDIIPVTKDMVEQPDMIEVFRQQAGEGLYKIWPIKPLEPGEYAVMEYTEGKMNLQVWDFRYPGK